MSLKKIINKVMLQQSLQLKPPVLVDVGASGGLPKEWDYIAPYSISIAFDADTREFSCSETFSNRYKKQFLLNRLVTGESKDEVAFYLTESPYCSSTLQPDNLSLEPWTFRGLFTVNELIKMPSINLWDAIKSCGCNYIDWYKTDTQGTDLRLFLSIPEDVTLNSTVIEFEPGIIDAYVGEDKLYDVMAHMDRKPFWISRMYIAGSQRVDKQDLASIPKLYQKYWDCFFKTAPGWCEITYINKFKDDNLGVREYLLGWVFTTLNYEHGFAMSLARIAKEKFGDLIFDDLYAYSKKSLPTYKGFLHVLKKEFSRLLNFKTS
jgi:hypothetical protein